MEPIKTEFLVVGGGIVGLAVASVLSQMGSTVLIEKEKYFLQHTSSRNSGVVHAGIYYPTDSLKTKLCIQGNRNIWQLQKHKTGAYQHIARQCGKWIGAVNADEEVELAKLAKNMEARGVPYRWVSKQEVNQKEPLISMTSVLESSSTGIIDVQALASIFHSMIASADTNSVAVTGTALRKLSGSETSMTATCLDLSTNETIIIETQKVISCMGNFSNALWDSIVPIDQLNGTDPKEQKIIPLRTFYCKGRYVGYRGKAPVSRLVYPCPLPNLKGLGVHSVIDVQGKVLFGPDAVYIDKSCSSEPEVDYNISPEEEPRLIESSYKAIRRYIPSIEKGRLFADFAGVRPKLSAEGEAARDFSIQSGHIGKGRDNLVTLLGIESPGLTSSTAIAEHVAYLVSPSRATKIRPLLPWAADK